MSVRWYTGKIPSKGAVLKAYSAGEHPFDRRSFLRDVGFGLHEPLNCTHGLAAIEETGEGIFAGAKVVSQ